MNISIKKITEKLWIKVLQFQQVVILVLFFSFGYEHCLASICFNYLSQRPTSNPSFASIYGTNSSNVSFRSDFLFVKLADESLPKTLVFEGESFELKTETLDAFMEISFSKLATQMGLKVRTSKYLFAVDANGNERLYFNRSRNQDLKEISKYQFTAFQQKIDMKVKILKKMLGISEGTGHSLNLDLEGNTVINIAIKNYELMDKRSDKSHFYPSHYEFPFELRTPDILNSLDSLQIADLLPLLERLKLDRNIFLIISQRHSNFNSVLQNGLEQSYDDPSSLYAKILEQQAKQENPARIKSVEVIKEKIKDRFLKDFLENTDFNSFEEYVSFVMGIPEYRKIIESYFNRSVIVYVAPQKFRIPIAIQGFESMFDTGHTPFNDSKGNYLKIRQDVEAENLGVSHNEYEYGSFLRPVSTFIFNRGQKITRDDTYGEDHYEISFHKLMQAIEKGQTYFSLTLFDSIRGSQVWYGKAIPFEFFPYFAAPFIHQATTEYQMDPNTTMSYNNLESVSPRPRFLKGLHNRMRLPVRTNSSWADHLTGTTISSDYHEVQLYGLKGLGLVDSIYFADQKPTDVYVSTLRQLNVKFKTAQNAFLQRISDFFKRE